MSRSRHIRHALLAGCVAALVVALAGAALAARGMQSTKLGPLLCETVGGGKFVAIPGFPGEKIDRRLLADIRWLRKRYPIFITDGYSLSDVHSHLGEHPLGLALDIVPNKAEGGTWADVTRLARWAERRQDRPRAPFRWVGYDGDDGHGRGHHLHLSWAHSETKPGHPAKLVHTLRCPDGAGAGQPPAPDEPPVGGSPAEGSPTGGSPGGGTPGDSDGGVSPKLELAAPVAEAGGAAR